MRWQVAGECPAHRPLGYDKAGVDGHRVADQRPLAVGAEAPLALHLAQGPGDACEADSLEGPVLDAEAVGELRQQGCHLDPVLDDRHVALTLDEPAGSQPGNELRGPRAVDHHLPHLLRPGSDPHRGPGTDLVSGGLPDHDLAGFDPAPLSRPEIVVSIEVRRQAGSPPGHQRRRDQHTHQPARWRAAHRRSPARAESCRDPHVSIYGPARAAGLPVGCLGVFAASRFRRSEG
jgi:hypothetical protein